MTLRSLSKSSGSRVWSVGPGGCGFAEEVRETSMVCPCRTRCTASINDICDSLLTRIVSVSSNTSVNPCPAVRLCGLHGSALHAPSSRF